MRNPLAERRLPRILMGSAGPATAAYVRGPAFQAFAALRVAYAALPIVAGADKFSHVLTNWSQYLAPVFYAMTGGRVRGFMHFVGLVEIGAGILVAARPRLGAPIVCLWLLAVVGNLLLIPGFYDVALRDAALAAGAFALFRLSVQYDR
jgi:hypothetical protein